MRTEVVLSVLGEPFGARKKLGAAGRPCPHEYPAMGPFPLSVLLLYTAKL